MKNLILLFIPVFFLFAENLDIEGSLKKPARYGGPVVTDYTGTKYPKSII